MAIPAGWKINLIAGLGGVAIGALAVASYYAFVRVPDRAATEQVVRDYILAHGEILPEAMDRMQRRQMTAAVLGHRAALETPFGSAWAGNARGDVVLVEFFDYACPYCHETNADVARLLGEDPGLKVVWRELPVIGPESEAAAYMSLAAARQGRFRAFHDRMFALGRPTDTLIAQAAREAGVTADGETPAARAEVERNATLVRQLQAGGTPTFVIGDRVLQGAVGYDALRDAIREARARS